MEKLPEELISEIFLRVDFETLKQCHCVCWKWCRIATEFLFRETVYRHENHAHFDKILAREDLSKFIRVVSFEWAQSSDTTFQQLHSISSHPKLWQLLLQPTVSVIRQHDRVKITTTLTDVDPKGSPSILPALQEIRFVTSQAYIPTQSFIKLRRLHVDMEFIQLPIDHVWPSLTSLHLRGSTLDIDRLERFLNNHKCIRQLYLAFVSMLEPLHPSSGELQNLLEKVLNSRLDTEVAGSIMRHAEKYASGHERSLLREIHAQLEESTDEKTATELRQTLVTLFEAMLRCELDRHIALVMEMRVPYENLSLELNFSIEYFWDDELAIKGITLPGDYLSETGVWKNDEVEQGLAMSKMCVTSFFETG